MAGKIIVVEGTDCSGKETQTKLLVKKLQEKGKKCIRFYFPNYESPTGRIIGGAYLGKPEINESFFKEGAVNVDPYVVSLYYAADRKYNLPQIQKYLDEDYYVIWIDILHLILHIKEVKFMKKKNVLICING